MKKGFQKFLESWPKNVIQASDVIGFLGVTADACYSLIKRAIEDRVLIRVKKGTYLIAAHVERQPVDKFELASFLYRPSFISLESALAYHGWIPEVAYTTSVCTKRAAAFSSSVGSFLYYPVPKKQFCIGTQRIKTQSDTVFIASAWRAVADVIYTKRKNWKTLQDLESGLDVTKEIFATSDVSMLTLLAREYSSHRVRGVLKRFLRDINKGLCI